MEATTWCFQKPPEWTQLDNLQASWHKPQTKSTGHPAQRLLPRGVGARSGGLPGRDSIPERG